jgi:tetratricopeptide (TPR) repeat protein
VALSSPESDHSGGSSRGDRLDCWKEIAAYLGRSEKTVRRWETDKGLPTHRAPGAGRTAVYAFTAELNLWLKSGRAQGLEVAEVDGETASAQAEAARLGAQPADVAMVNAHDSAPTETGANLSAQKRSLITGWKPVLVGIVAALAVGGAVVAAVYRSTLDRSPHRISPIPGEVPTATDHPVPIAVSDAQRARAHDFYLKGRYDWSQRTPDSLNRALDDFTQAVVNDPEDAQAYVGLADTYDLLREFSTMAESEAYPRAIAAARRAVELDDSLAEAHRALAFTEFYGSWDFVDAEKEFVRAIQLNPNDPVAYRWYANAIAVLGRFDESLEQIRKAVELDPSSHSTLADKGLMLFQAGKREEGIALLHRVERADSQFFSPHYYLRDVSLELRDYPTYLMEGQKAAEISNNPMQKDIIAAARAGYAQGGGKGLLTNLYAKQKEYYLAGKLQGTIFAITCVLMGRTQEALQLLEEDYARHDATVFFCLSNPELLTLRDEPRYRALVRKINFPSKAINDSPETSRALDPVAIRAASPRQDGDLSSNRADE